MFRQIATAIIYSNIWIASGAALLTAQTFWVSGIEVNVGLVFFVFFASLATYNLQRLLRFNKWWLRATSERLHWLVHSRKSLLSITVLSLIAAGIFALFSLKPIHLWALFPMTMVAILYAWPFIPSEGGRLALRDIPGLKIFWIAGSWVAVTAVLPLLGITTLSSGWVMLMLERFFFILAITVPFDVRDLHFDAATKKTIPQVFGTRRSGWIALSFNALFLVFVLTSFFSDQYNLQITLVLGACGAINATVLFFSFRQRPEPYYSVVLDGLTILQPAMVFLMSH